MDFHSYLLVGHFAVARAEAVTVVEGRLKHAEGLGDVEGAVTGRKVEKVRVAWLIVSISTDWGIF
jgi:hypothetical protein